MQAPMQDAPLILKSTIVSLFATEWVVLIYDEMICLNKDFYVTYFFVMSVRVPVHVIKEF